MSDFDRKVEALIQSFAVEMNSLVREAAMQAVQEALQPAKGAGAGPKSRRRAAAKPAPAEGKKATPKRKKRGAKAGKRSPEDIVRLQEKVLTFLDKNPAAKVSDIAGALGLSTSDLNLPMRRLKAEKSVRTEGHKRNMVYFKA